MAFFRHRCVGVLAIPVLGLIILHAGCTERAANTQITTVEKPATGALRLTPVGIDASEPDMAADDQGNIYVVFAEHVKGRTADIKLLKLDINGKTSGEAVQVNSEPGAATVWAGDPPRIVVAGPNIYVSWTRKLKDVSHGGNDLVLSVSRDSGATFDPPVRVNDDVAPASHGMHSLAVAENGDVVMLWLDERSLVGRTAPAAAGHEMSEPNAEVFYAISRDDGKTFGTNTKIAGDVCPCCKTTLLAAKDRTIYAAWRHRVRRAPFEVLFHSLTVPDN